MRTLTLVVLLALTSQVNADDAIVLKSGSKFTRTVAIDIPQKEKPPEEEKADGEKDEDKEPEERKTEEKTRTYTITNVGAIGETGRAAIKGTFDFAYPDPAKGEFFGYYETEGSQQIVIYGVGADESPQKFTNPRISGYLTMKQAEKEGDEPTAMAMLTTSDSTGNSEETSAGYSVE